MKGLLFFPESILEVLGEECSLKNLNVSGELIGEGWKYGLIVVDLMPTLAERLLHS